VKKTPLNSSIYIDFQHFPEQDLLVNMNSTNSINRAEHILKVSFFIELIEKFQPRYVLVHGYAKDMEFDKQLEKWIREVLIPQIVNTRVKKLAFVADDIAEEITIIPISSDDFLVCIFSSEEKARNWLFESS